MRENKFKNGKPYFSKEAWRYYFGFFSGQHRKLLLTSVVATAQAALIIPILLLVRYIFDVAIPEKKVDMLVEDQRILHARIVQDTERIMRMSNSMISGLIPAILISIGLCVILLVFNWFLFVVIILFFPVIFFSNRYMGKILKKRVFAYQRSFENFSKGVLFLLKFLDLIKIQTAEKIEEKKQRKVLKDLKEKATQRTYFTSINFQVQTFLVSISGILVIVVGGVSVINEFMTLGDFFAFYIAANHLQTNLNSINNSFAKVLTGNESLITLQHIAATTEKEPYSGNRKIAFKGNIELRSVIFGYNEKPVLQGISLKITPESKIAVIGPNGAGKSTIIHLILGFYAPQSGTITAEGVDFKEIDFSHFRKQVGVVSQHPLLFPGSIIENITYGNERTEKETVIKISKITLAHNFIEKLEDGYETQIGEDGVLLSGGERQKIALARALLNRPKLLILDEPTNHLDDSAVKEILSNLDHIDFKPAVFVISHDKAVANFAENIYLLENGKLQSVKNEEL